MFVHSFLSWWRLLALVQSMAFVRIPEEDVVPLATDIRIAAEIEAATSDEELAAAAWIGPESGGQGVMQSYGLGSACAATQLEFTARAGHPCSELNANRVLAIQLWFRALHTARARCGSLRGGLSALSSANRCDGAPGLVSWRMANGGIQ